MGRVRAVCISEKKGTAKRNVGKCNFLEDFGLENDAHGGKWHRQVSLLSYEAVEAFRARGAQVEDGAFGENLLVEGFDFKSFPVGTIFQMGFHQRGHPAQPLKKIQLVGGLIDENATALSGPGSPPCAGIIIFLGSPPACNHPAHPAQAANGSLLQNLFHLLV